MAKKEEVAETKEVATTENAPAVIDDGTGKMVSISDVLKQMEEAEVGMELVSDYLKFEIGQSERLLFYEMGTIKDQNSEDAEETKQAVVFIDKFGKMRKTADVVLVNFCANLESKGKKLVPLQVECIGMKGVKPRQYREFSIKNLLM